MKYTFWNILTFTWQRNKKTDGLDNIFQVQQKSEFWRMFHNSYSFDKKYVESAKPSPHYIFFKNDKNDAKIEQLFFMWYQTKPLHQAGTSL